MKQRNSVQHSTASFVIQLTGVPGLATVAYRNLASQKALQITPEQPAAYSSHQLANT